MNERSLLIRRPPFSRTKAIGDAYNDDFVKLSVQFFTQFPHGHADSSLIEVKRVDASYDLFQMRASQQYALGTVLERTLGWRLRHSWTPSRAGSFAHAHSDAGRCYEGKIGHSSSASSTGTFALAFWREVLACLDFVYTAAVTLVSSERCRVNGAL